MVSSAAESPVEGVRATSNPDAPAPSSTTVRPSDSNTIVPGDRRGEVLSPSQMQAGPLGQVKHTISAVWAGVQSWIGDPISDPIGTHAAEAGEFFKFLQPDLEKQNRAPGSGDTFRAGVRWQGPEIRRQLQQYAPFLTATQAQSIMRFVLKEMRDNAMPARMLGALLSGRPAAEAEQAATALERDGFDTLVKMPFALEDAPLHVYEPFMSRLRRVENFELFLVSSDKPGFGKMPLSVRDEFCLLALKTPANGTPDRRVAENTWQMFRLFRYLSGPAQQAVYATAESIYASSSPADRLSMKELYIPSKISRDATFEGVPQSVRAEWESLFAD
jgi:hypothetical protein